MEKESFVFHKDWYDAVKDLDDNIRLEVYDSIMHSVYNGKMKEISPMAQMALSFILPHIERDREKYNTIKLRRSEAGRRHRGNQYSRLEQNGTNGTNGTSVPNLEQMEQNGTNGTVSVSVSDSVSVSKGTKVPMLDKKNNIIIPPTPQGEEKEILLAKFAEMEERQKALEEQNAELKEKLENAKKKNNDIDLSIVSEEMKPVVEEWLAYKRQKRQGYKPMGFVKFYNKFMKDCGGDVSVAKKMVEFSIANNYDGLFKPKGGYRELPGQVIREENLDFNKGFFGL